MGRYSPNPGKQHRVYYIGWGCWRISWVCDRYYKGSRQRFPKVYQRDTDRKGAERFAKKHGIAMPDVPVEDER